MPSRAISRKPLNGRSEIIGNNRTEGHGLIIQPQQTTGQNTESIISNPKIGGSVNTDKKYLKIKPKTYISFD